MTIIVKSGDVVFDLNANDISLEEMNQYYQLGCIDGVVEYK